VAALLIAAADDNLSFASATVAGMRAFSLAVAVRTRLATSGAFALGFLTASGVLDMACALAFVAAASGGPVPPAVRTRPETRLTHRSASAKAAMA